MVKVNQIGSFSRTMTADVLIGIKSGSNQTSDSGETASIKLIYREMKTIITGFFKFKDTVNSVKVLTVTVDCSTFYHL